MQLNRLFAISFNIHIDAININSNFNLIKRKKKNDLIGTHNFSFSLHYQTNEDENLINLKKKGLELFEDENYKVIIFNDENISIIEKIFDENECDLIEFVGDYIFKDDLNKEKILIIDRIDFIKPNFLQKDIIDKRKELDKVFNLENLGITVDVFNEKYLSLFFLSLNRRLKDNGVKIYEKYNIKLNNDEYNREIEIFNNDNNRNNLVLMVQDLLFKNNIDIKLRLGNFSFRNSEIINNTFRIEKISFKILN